MIVGTAVRIWLAFGIPAILAAPLLRRAFPGLRDGGVTVARPAAWLLIAWVAWFLPSLPGLPIYGTPLVLAATLALAGLGGAIGWSDRRIWKELLAREWKTIAIGEALGLAAFAVGLWLVQFNGDIHPLAERFMDYAILKRLTLETAFPPQDSWMAGLTLQYYYYGYVVMDCLRRLSGLELREFFNPALPAVHATFAIALYGAGMAIARTRGAGLLAAIGGAFVGNYELFRQIVWMRHRAGSWRFLGFNWFDTSRVIPGTINETPAFATFWGDLHPYLIAFPFVVLCVTLAVASVTAEIHPLAGDRPRRDRLLALALLVIPLGALFPTNSWDFPTFLGLALAALAWPLVDRDVLGRAGRSLAARWRGPASAEVVTERRLALQSAARMLVKPVVVVGVVAVLSVLAYVFFHVGFGKQVGRGVRLAQRRSEALPMMLHFGPWLLVILLWAVTAAKDRSTALLRVAPLPAFALLLGAFEMWGDHHVAGIVQSLSEAGWIALARGLDHLLLRGLAFVLVVAALWVLVADLEASEATSPEGISRLLAGAALFVVLVCEFAYVDDFYGGENERMNTIFKAYIQAWILLAIGCAGLLAVAWRSLAGKLVRTPAEVKLFGSVAGVFLLITLVSSGPLATGQARLLAALCFGVVFAVWRCLREGALVPRPVFAAAVGLVAVPGLTFPALADYNRSAGFRHTRSSNLPTYDPLDLFRQRLPDDHAAIGWVEANLPPDAVLVEAAAHAYEWESRFSTFTGRLAVVGWKNHESGWRNSWALATERGKIVDAIYASETLDTAWRLCREAGVQYVIVGDLERKRVAPKGEPEYRLDKFFAEPPLHVQGSLRIYRVPAG